jgi:hypothetical protein
VDGDGANAFFEGAVARLREKNLLSDEQFKVDATLLAWVEGKSFRRKYGKSEPPEGGGSNPGELSRREAEQRDA